MDPLAYGTLYDTFNRTVAKWRDRPAYGVPPMGGRAYHPKGVEYTWGQTAAAVEELKKRYAAAGYRNGHRVAFLFDQRPEFFFHYYALNALGCSVVPVNPEHKQDEVCYVLSHSESCLLVALHGRMAEMKAASAALDRPIPVVCFEDLPARLPEPPAPGFDRKPDGATEAALLYTSGTTGRPKGCILTNEYFHTYGSWYASRGGEIALREGAERLYNPLPLHHANCLGIASPALLLTGGCLFFPDRFHPTTWWKDMVACGITAYHYQGVIPNMLIKLPPCPEERQHHVRFGLGVGIDPQQHQAFEQRFGVKMVEFWAMTETGRLIVDNHEPRSIHTRAFGRVTPGIEARVVDENERDVPPGQIGELVIRHSAAAPRKGFFSGYLKNESATDDTWRNGWFHSGDVVVRDEAGMFYFVDRKKNIIRRSGENIAAAEVEGCLASHSDVKQVAVLAVADELREEEVMACVITRSGEAGEALARELFEWCNERLAYFKVPAYYLFVESLPTTSTQKIRKVEIFPKGTDPRTVPGVIDLRTIKKKPAPRAALAG